MNKSQKIIWTIYLVVLTVVLLDSLSYRGGGEVFFAFLLVGWIPFLIAHKIWKDKK